MVTIDEKTGDPDQDLANAIIIQAARDYRTALRGIRRSTGKAGKKYWNYEKTVSDCERFFTGEVFELLTDLDGAWLMRKLRNECNAVH